MSELSWENVVEQNQPLPDFITSARRELMESVVFFAFFGAIVALYYC
jgi:hypothetical protein